MRVRHKIPNVFSLSMLDVLCCALGCVILLWLLGTRQAADDAAEMRDKASITSAESASLLSDANSRLLLERDRAVALEARLAQRIAELERLRDQLGTEFRASQAEARDVRGRLKTSMARVSDLEAALSAGMAALDEEHKKLDEERKKSGALGKKLADAEASVKATRADLASEKKSASATRRQLDDLEREAESRKAELKKITQTIAGAETARKKLADTLDLRDKALADAKERERVLEGRLRERATAMAEATRAFEALKAEADALRAAAKERDKEEKDKDGRFAGITLTGKRVVFLVDVSGSMTYVDEKTESPEKWPEVCNTVGKLMRSLPQLEKYQVICFNTKVVYLLGGGGEWRDHDPKKSPDQVVKALRGVKPVDGTNMYVAIKAAFEFRGEGLDTVYLLSDGLPNKGEGISEEKEEELKPLKTRDRARWNLVRGQLLGEHVRAKLKKDWNRPDRKLPLVKINTIGFYYESPDLGSFLWALARDNGGNFVGMSKP